MRTAHIDKLAEQLYTEARETALGRVRRGEVSASLSMDYMTEPWSRACDYVKDVWRRKATAHQGKGADAPEMKDENE